LGAGRGGLLLTSDAQALAAWLDRGTNRDEWQRLVTALELAEGFVFFPVYTRDELAGVHIGALLAQFAASERLSLCDVELNEGVEVSLVLDRLRAAARPALFWIHRGDGNSNLDELLALLNQKREVISTLADAPLVMTMHPQDWERFRRHAPDFWSIHQTVARFSPGRGGSPHLRSPPRIRARPSSLAQAPVSGWRVSADDLAGRTPPNLFGRESEISFLVSTLGSPGARILISGQPGTGKTTLLSAAVSRVADYFPDGIWWVPFNLAEGEPQDRSGVILERLVAELVSGTAGQRSIEDLGRLFRNVTASMEALFVFEDVDDLGAIERLVPGPQASMLVTTSLASGSGLPGDVVDLSGLGVEAGAALLRARTKLDARTARQVASATGGSPAVLTLLATILADAPESAAALIERLSDHGTAAGGAKVDAVLDAGVERVLDARTDPAQAAWPKLALFRERFDLLDASAVLGAATGEQVRAILVELARAGLIEPLASADEYRFFALVRASAQRRLDVRDDAMATRVAYARRVLIERKSLNMDLDVQAAIDSLRNQYRESSRELRDIVRSIGNDIAATWAERDFADDVMQFLMELFEAEGDARRLAGVYEWFGGVALDRDQVVDARRWYQAALDVSEAGGAPAMIASAYVGLGDVARSDGDDQRALESYQKALDLGALEKSRLSAVHRKMGDTALSIYDQSAAARHYQAAVDEARAIDDVGQMSASYRGLASVAFNDGELDAAAQFAHLAVGLCAPGDVRGVARGYQLLGSIEERRGDAEAARAWYEKALSAFGEAGGQADVAWLQFSLGGLAFKVGDLDAAHFRYGRALEALSELDDPDSVMEINFWLGRTAVLRGALDDAEAYFVRGLALAREIGHEEEFAYFLLGDLAAKRGQFERAMAYWIRVMREFSAEQRGVFDIEQAVMQLHTAAPDVTKPILRKLWEDAGLEWPGDADADDR
jgi:tetratricopeptide (TPR) repeat protein